jgi:simple sugar transport system ATP-binding protein
MMLGEDRPASPVVRSGTPGAVVLEIEGLRVRNDLGIEAIAGLGLSVRAGEIVGIAGVSGNGQRELIEALAGQRPVAAGAVRVSGEPYRATRAQLKRHAVHVLPEEPLRNACVPYFPVADNLALRVFDEPPHSAFGGLWLRRGRILGTAKRLMQAFRVQAPSLFAPLFALSGGNIQRTVLARELGGDPPRLLVLANPCFGLDIAAVDSIHTLLLEARNRGCAVLLISEDLDELLKLSDRLAVLHHGHLTHECSASDADLGTIGRAMAGV